VTERFAVACRARSSRAAANTIGVTIEQLLAKERAR
jgi:hypothetical protein